MQKIYILMPFRFGVSSQPEHHLAEVHVGRGKKLNAAREALEKKLNKGRTYQQWTESIFAESNPELRVKLYQERERKGYHVIADTFRNWGSFPGSSNWPVMQATAILHLETCIQP